MFGVYELWLVSSHITKNPGLGTTRMIFQSEEHARDWAKSSSGLLTNIVEQVDFVGNPSALVACPEPNFED